MGLFKIFAAIATVAVCGGVAQADDLDQVAAKFGARPSILDASLSPDGDKVALISSRKSGPGENVVVIDLATAKTESILSSSGTEDHLRRCHFILVDRVVCTVFLTAGKGGDIDSATRLVSVATDGSSAKLITDRQSARGYSQSRFGGEVIDFNVPGEPDSVLIESYRSPEFSTGHLAGSNESGYGVEKVNIRTLGRAQVERPRATASSFISDGQGNIRIIGIQPVNTVGYAQNTENFLYRSAPGQEWKSFGSVTSDSSGIQTGFYPLSVDPARNVVYGFEGVNGRQALFERALDGSNATRLLLSSSSADVDRLVVIGRDQRVVGVSYATERRLVEYFDPELKKLASALARAIPDQPQIDIGDASKDERKLLILAAGDTSPGMYYLYDKDTRKLGELLPLRPELAGTQLATVKPITFPARDGTLIPGYLTLPPGSSGKGIPAIVMPHGGPASRDEWGFDWLPQFFAARGFAVLQPNYRGSTGFGANWFEKNGFQSWPIAMNDVLDAGHWLVQQGIATPAHLAIVGWSYGGYAALQTAVVEPDVFKAVVAIAPVTDLDRFKDEFKKFSNYRIMEQYVGTGPHTAAGSPARHAEMFKAPVLMFHADKDRNVGVAESRLMRDRLAAAGKSVQYIEFPGLDHQIDDTASRIKLLTMSDQFLRKSLGLSAGN